MSEKRKEQIKQKLVEKYRLVVLTEETYEEKFSFKLTRLNVFVVGGTFSILLILLTIGFVAYTPLKEYIPGFESPELKKNAIRLNSQLDSLQNRLIAIEKYTESLKPVLIGEKAIELEPLPYTPRKGESIFQKGIYNNDSIHKKIDNLINQLRDKNTEISRLRQQNNRLTLLHPGAIERIRREEKQHDHHHHHNHDDNEENTANLERSRLDSIYRAKVEKEERFSLFGHEHHKLEQLFIKPVEGAVTQGFNIAEKHYALDVASTENAPVKSIAEGVVVFCEWSLQTGYVIAILHQENYLSIYKHNSKLNTTQGSLVKAGEIIANVGSEGELSTGPHLHFEIWKDGYPLDPTTFMKF